MKETIDSKNININDIPINAQSDLSESEESLEDSSFTNKDEEKDNISCIPKIEESSYFFADEKSEDKEDIVNIIKGLDNSGKTKEAKEEEKTLDLNNAKTDFTTKTKNKDQKFIEKAKEKYFINKKRKEK